MEFRFARGRSFNSLFHANTRNISTESSRTAAKDAFIRSSSMNDLYRRLSPVRGDASVVPILDQWVNEGRPVHKQPLHVMVKQLRHHKCYSHALQLSTWMSEKRYYNVTTRDAAVRLDLISKVHGIQKAEDYFLCLPKQLRSIEVYGALLHCYVHIKSVEKAEALFQVLRDLDFGHSSSSLPFNVMLTLYYRAGNRGKFDALLQEMEEKKIQQNSITASICINAYAAFSDIEGMEKTLKRFESDPKYVLDWNFYYSSASAYLKCGLGDKALAMLRKSEGLIAGQKKSSDAYAFLIGLYAATGNKDEVMRVWEYYKKNEKVYNFGYINVITSVLKFDDIETAEKIYEEWESQNLSLDIRITNILVDAYSRKGLIEKAEVLTNKVISKGIKTNWFTWHCMAKGYLNRGQHRKAVESLKKALLFVGPLWWRRSKECSVACLKYLKEEGDVEEAEEIVELLRSQNLVCVDVYDRLIKYIRDERTGLDSLSDLLTGEVEDDSVNLSFEAN